MIACVWFRLFIVRLIVAVLYCCVCLFYVDLLWLLNVGLHIGCLWFAWLVLITGVCYDAAYLIGFAELLSTCVDFGWCYWLVSCVCFGLLVWECCALFTVGCCVCDYGCWLLVFVLFTVFTVCWGYLFWCVFVISAGVCLGLIGSFWFACGLTLFTVSIVSSLDYLLVIC